MRIAAPPCQRPAGTAWRRALLFGFVVSLAGVFSAEPAIAAEPAPAAAPLAARSGPRGATLFTPLAAASLGVIAENKYADPRMWGDRYQEFALGSIGTGVAIGDYDNDGRPDLFVVSKTETCRLFRNLGDWKFADVTAAAGVLHPVVPNEPWKQGATFADINNDGWLDLYVCRFNAPNLLFVNQGDGTFKEEAAARGLAVVDASGMAAFCDYDRDGWLDVFVQTNMLDASAHPNGQRDHLFRNRGDGTFANVTDQAGISGDTLAHSATWWDYDLDGWPDLYVAKDFGPLDSLYRNNRDGTFTDVISEVAPHAAFSSMGADFGDVNNDGLIDFLVADMAARTHENDHRGMASSRSLAVEDPDPLVAPQYPRNALYLNTGRGALLEAATLAGLAATDWTWSARFEDLDNDGRLDLHVTNGMNREYQNTDLRDRIILAENPAERMRIMRSSRVLNEANLAFRNAGDLRFEDVSAAWGLDEKGVSFGAAFGDLDGDGDLDLVYSNYGQGVSILRNDSDQGHRLIVSLRGTTSNRFGVGATVRLRSAAGEQVRTLVLARGYLSSSEPILHFGLGDDAVIQELTVTWPGGKTQTFHDVPADRHLTLTEPAGASALPAPLKPAAGQFADISTRAGLDVLSRRARAEPVNPQALLPIRQSHRGPAAAVGDVNGDGLDDLVVGGTPLDPARILLGQPGAVFKAIDAASLVVAEAVDDGPLLLFDADADGDQDLLITKGGANLPRGSPKYQPNLFLNDGRGGFQPAAADTLPALPINAGAVAAADFDRDGHLDVFIGARVRLGQYPLPPASALLAWREGRFIDVVAELAPGLRDAGMVTSALWSDVDADGWPDLLVALEWGGVRYWHNQEGSAFEDWSERAGFAAAGTGWWNSLAAADFNSDGRLDYAAGNLGLNTQYHAEPARPALLFSGDFAGTGSSQIVEAFHEGERVFPWRTKKDLGARIPSVLKRFPRNDDYARSTLEEIVGADRLAKARRFAATEFRSGVFLSQPDGTWRFSPLPRLAQIAPLQGLVAGDFDGDGRADLYAVQNSYAPSPVVGRFDGGLSQLLRGDGRGGFTPATLAETDLLVSGDAKALVTLDLDADGWPDFFVTRNNRTAMAYRNNGVDHHRSFRVSLRGPAGNPTAIGAVITVEASDGTTQTAVISAGSGYYSQPAAAAFFGFNEKNPPRRLLVRWPDGKSTTHAADRLAPAIVLSPESP